jgi:hypothetical protein
MAKDANGLIGGGATGHGNRDAATAATGGTGHGSNQPRDSHGRWASAGSSEASQRDAGRHPVTSHAGARSVNTHTGLSSVAKLNMKTGHYGVTHGGRRLATAETIAKGMRVDDKNAVTRVR